MRTLHSLLIAAATGLLAAGAAWAQGWPADKPITMIVPFPPGGVADTVARPVAEALGKELKQTVIVENRVGAGGALGMGMAARVRCCCGASSRCDARRTCSAARAGVGCRDAQRPRGCVC